MDITNYNGVRDFRICHSEPDCKVTTDLTDDNKSTVTLFCQKHNELILTYIPYRMFCMHIDKCAGYNSCPRNYACSE